MVFPSPFGSKITNSPDWTMKGKAKGKIDNGSCLMRALATPQVRYSVRGEVFSSLVTHKEKMQGEESYISNKLTYFLTVL